ncbi:MAG: hypothetical protein ACQEP5_00500 [Actinomycetota bacterium]
MTVNLEEKINYLSNELNFKLQIKASYIIWSLGLEGSGDTRAAGDFYRFCNDFFSVWERYLNRISPLVDEFNRRENARPDYAEILGKQYEQYLQSLKSLKVPASVSGPFRVFLEWVYAKKNYFNSYSDRAIGRIEYSDGQEYRFWQKLHEKNMEIGGPSKEFGRDEGLAVLKG